MKPPNRRSWNQQKLSIATGQGGTSSTTTYQISPASTNRLPADKESGGCVTVAEYAQHAGVTVQAIYQRMRAGQLGDAVRRHDSRYLVNPQRADAAWAMHGKPANSRAAQLEARLMLLPDQLADELAGMDATYCRVALTRVILNLLD